MKKYKTNIIILILISVLIMYLIMKDDFKDIMSALTNIDIKFLFVALILMGLYVFFQSLSLHLYLKSIKKDYKLKDTFILMCSAQFFNAITPFSSGGQPFQMYLLKSFIRSIVFLSAYSAHSLIRIHNPVLIKG